MNPPGTNAGTVDNVWMQENLPRNIARMSSSGARVVLPALYIASPEKATLGTLISAL
jgi:hypothetical protein